MSPTSENLITFLKSMTRNSLENYDPRYENCSLEECLKIKANQSIGLSEALKHPHLVMPKLKLEYSWTKYSEMAFAWYQMFVYVAEWAKGIPQFRMLDPRDQEQLFHQNFATVTFPMMFLNQRDCQSYLDMLEDSQMVISNQAIAPEVLHNMAHKLFDVYQVYINEPYENIKPDEEEIILIMTIMLFQFSESLSNEGHLICKKYKEKLYTALYEYQIFKFSDKTEIERVYRYTILAEMMHRITRVWNEESEFHLLLATFKEMNIDGLLQELLFNKTIQ